MEVVVSLLRISMITTYDELISFSVMLYFMDISEGNMCTFVPTLLQYFIPTDNDALSSVIINNIGMSENHLLISNIDVHSRFI